MADNYLNSTGLAYFYNRIKTIFASAADLTALDAKVDEIIAEGGEPNVIEGININGAAVPPDDNKIVNFDVPVSLTTNTPEYLQTEVVRGGFGIDFIGEIPAATSDLTNDGDGESNYATEAYVALHGGKIDTIKVNGTAQTITDKAVDIPVPTNNNQLTNGAGYQTAADVDAIVDAAIAGVTQFDYEIVQTLPASGVKGTIYLVPNATHEGEYDEYIWVDNAWQQIGHTSEIDLTAYWAKAELVAITTAEIDALFAA